MSKEKKVKRMIDCFGEDFSKMSSVELKESIRLSEGRVLMAQHLIMAGPGIIKGITNSEILAAFGSDMIMLNTYHPDLAYENPGMLNLSVKELKSKIRRPVGIYLGCPAPGKEDVKSFGPLATEKNVRLCLESGADFIILGGNPGAGTTLKDIIEATRMTKKIVGNEMMIFAGKWEDGVNEKVLGDPLAKEDAKKIIGALIDAGADVIDLPAPGSRAGISVDMIRELVEFTHRYKKETLTMVFLDSSVESADRETIRAISLKMKETGTDIHAIGDGGFAGCTDPENIYQMSVTLRGKRFTMKRMAGTNR